MIESILLGIPIPAFYFDEDEQGKMSVIDGLQRLSTIHQFINGQFLLQKLQYLPDCEKKKFDELDIRYRRRLLETILVVNLLDARCSSMIKMDIFRRVNTGGIHLNPQEIRNIMASADVRNLLIEMSTSEEFAKATQGRIKDIRMGAQEICLRYLTIVAAYDWEKDDMEQFQGLLKMMDACILILSKAPKKYLDDLLNTFRLSMMMCWYVLGENSFCKSGNTRINKALFTSWAVVLYNLRSQREVIEKNCESIRKKYLEILKGDKEFFDVISSSTGSKKNILYAIRVIRSLVEAYL